MVWQTVLWYETLGQILVLLIQNLLGWKRLDSKTIFFIFLVVRRSSQHYQQHGPPTSH